jgi:exodeoxyribonuclease VII small subunit
MEKEQKREKEEEKVDPSTTYEAAYAELQAILQLLQAPTLSVDVLHERVARGAILLKFCQNKLRTVENDLLETLGRPE